MAVKKKSSTVDSTFKAKSGGIVNQVFLKKASTNATVSDASVQRGNVDLTTLRTYGTDKETLKHYIDYSPDLSLASSSLARFAITDSYTVIAYTLDGKIDVTATESAITLANRLDKLKPSYQQYIMPSDFRSCSESMIKCLNISGSYGSELVLGKDGLPQYINVFSTRELKYEQAGNKLKPYLVIDGENVYLDSPLVDIQNLDLNPESPYTFSPFTSAIQPVIADLEFANDLRRAFRKANIPRVTAEIVMEKWLQGLPAETRFDPVKLKAAADEIIFSIQAELNQLNPEDAIVNFDSVKVQHLSAGNVSSHEAAKEQRAMLNGRMSSGTRTLPSILGRGESSGTASTESMLYLRHVEGIQEKLNTTFSTHLTTGVRLLGHDCFVKFSYASPNLRPAQELESFNALKQSRILELLSLGMISDEEASIVLTGGLPSGTYTNMSGTGFRANTSVDTGAENPYSNTSVTTDGVTDTASGKQQTAKDKNPKSNSTSGK